MERRQIFKDIVPGHVSLNAELDGTPGEPDYQRSTDLIGSLQQDEILEEAGRTLWPEFRTARNKAGLWLRMPEGFERQTQLRTFRDRRSRFLGNQNVHGLTG
jgi:hypothetical protein